MKNFQSAKLILLMIAAVMVIGSMPMSVFATTTATFSNAQLSVVTNKQSTLADGVTQDIYTVYDKNGDQVKMFAATIDMSVDTVNLFTSYKDMDNTSYGMSKLTEQVDAFNKKAEAGDSYYQGTVVVGINTSYYNMTTGKPTGVFVMNGNDVTTESEGNNYGYFAVMKDGTVKIGNKGDYSNDKENIQEALGIYTMLVYNDKIVLSEEQMKNTQKYPRQTIGITEDDKVIILSADGNQAPSSVGLTLAEQAQVMLDLGCKWAGHLDGGGSMTYGSKGEGENEFAIVNSPSDGSERSISNGLIVASTAVSDGKFDHIVFEAENEYVTPGTSTTITIKGVDKAGGSAQIPGDVTYEVINGTYENDVLTATTIGDVILTVKYNGKSVGSFTTHAVVPDALKFNNSDITVPFGKAVSLGLTATYGLNTVAFKASDITFNLENAAVGTIDGFTFTACAENEENTKSKIFAKLNIDSDITAEAMISLGKASEIVMSFEDQDISGLKIKTGYPQYGPMGNKKDENENYYYNGQNEIGEISVVTAENGKVHDGNYALAVECDYTQIYETGYHMLSLSDLNFTVPAKAQAIGMWIYLPELEDIVATYVRICGTDSNGKTVSSPSLWDNAGLANWENSGWHYFSMDLSEYDSDITFGWMQFYISDRDNSSTDYYFKDHASVNGKFTYYIDSITIDYSSAVDDREPPVFSNLTYATEDMADAAVLNNQTVNKNNISFSVGVKDDMSKTNYTGINASTVKAYIDGIEVDSVYENSKISTTATLADGVHTVRFEACDNMGNLSYIVRQITIAANSDLPTISIVPEDLDADKILIGSVYWVDVIATDIEKVSEVELELNLNSVSQWQLANMEVAYGFNSTYVIDKVTNNAVITIQSNGNNKLNGENVIARIPIRTWESTITQYEGYESQTPETLWSRKIIWPMDIKLSAYKGAVKFTDGTKGSFSMSPIEVVTELYGNYAKLNENGDYTNKKSWHIHTETALEDKDETCTESGYESRTFCEVCDSVVNWGKTKKATGHSYNFEDGILKCSCGEKFNGEWTDGKTYVDGITAVTGWDGDSYYKDGVKLTGVQKLDGYYYDFGTDGISKGKYTGLFYDEINQVYRYSQLGELSSGWKQINDEWYYFRQSTLAAVTGKYYYYSGVEYTFDETGKLLHGVWAECDEGKKYYYGPGAYNLGWHTIEGNKYYFYSFMALTGNQAILESNSPEYMPFVFTQDGVWCDVEVEDGFFVTAKANYYVRDGHFLRGLQKIDDKYYYFSQNTSQMRTGNYLVLAKDSNGILKEDTVLTFDATQGYAVDVNGNPLTTLDSVNKLGIYEENGNLYYYVNDVVQKVGAFEYNGNTYYASTNTGKLAIGTYYVLAKNGNNIITENGYYYFDVDGKLVTSKTGIYKDNGNLYYYVDDKIQKVGAFTYNGNTYYASTNTGKLATGKYYIMAKNGNNIINKDGYYYFDDNGKLINAKTGIYEDNNGNLYYYVDDVVQKVGAFEYNGNTYYASTNTGKLAIGTYYVLAKNGNNIITEDGYYYFDVDGKLVTSKTGIYKDNGNLYYYVDDKIQKVGAFTYNGNTYYASTNTGKLATGKYYIMAKNGNNIINEDSYYYFDDNGKLLN